MERLLHDLRISLRSLARHWAFTLIAVITLTLGIGANTAVFSIVDALLLRPYPFADLDRLVLARQAAPHAPNETRMPPADFIDLRREASSFQGLAAFRVGFSALTGAGEGEPVVTCAVSPAFFSIIGSRPALGRAFSAEEEQPGRDQVAILSHGYWRRRFGGDPGLVGKTVSLNGRSFTVVGVMPEDFRYPPAVELWTPLALTAELEGERLTPAFEVLGRLRPGVSLGQARMELRGFAARLARQYPSSHQDKGLDLLRLREEQYRFDAALFLTLQAAALFVLLLAAVNVLNLLFARLLGRQKELAIRSAMGASRRRLAQLFLSETVPLSLLAGLLALASASPAVALIRDSIPADYTRWIAGWSSIRVDARVVGFAMAVTFAAAALFALGAAWQTSRYDLNRALKEAAGRGSSGGGRSRLRSGLIVLQVVCATVLLIGAGLMVKGFLRLMDVYGKLDPGGVLTLRLGLPEQRYGGDAQVRSFYQRVLQQISQLPGVESAGMATNLPASNVDNQRTSLVIEGRPLLLPGDAPAADLQVVSPGFFRALRIPLLAGRAVADQDGADAPRVVVISKAMARQLWPAADPLGRRVRLGAPGAAGPWVTVVGVVGDVTQNWWDSAARPVVYVPYLQSPRRTMVFAVRASLPPVGLASGIRRIVREADANVAAQEGVHTMAGEVADALAPLRILGVLMLLFGGVALALAAVGVYGILAQSVAQRTTELGIRLALGGQRGDVLRLVLGQAWALAASGVAIGLPLAFALARVMASLLSAVIAFDAAIFAGLALLMTAVALLAAYVPAQRALRIDPALALRAN